MRYERASQVIQALCVELGLEPNRVTAIDIQLRPADLVRVRVEMLPADDAFVAPVVALFKQPEMVVEVDDGPPA